MWQLFESVEEFFAEKVKPQVLTKKEQKLNMASLVNMMGEAYTRYVLSGFDSLDFEDIEWPVEPYLQPEQHQQRLERAVRAAEAAHRGVRLFAQLAPSAAYGEDADWRRIEADSPHCASVMQNVMHELVRLLDGVVSAAVRGQ